MRALDMRRVTAPLALPVWSDEADDDDWMPDVPLDAAILDRNGGALRRLIDGYYASPSDATLLAAVNAFREIVRPSGGDAVTTALCYGDTGAHPRAADCFQARRWMSSLAAVHFLRTERAEDIPNDVVHLWWETGEAAVSTNFIPPGRVQTRERVLRTAGWLYLAFTYAPMDFREENGYLGQFLQTAGYERLAMLAELRRMVGTGGVHDRAPDEPFWDAQVFWDGWLAVVRAPNALKGRAALFVVDYLIASIDAGATFRPDARQLMTNALRSIDDEISRLAGLDPTLRDQISARRAALDARIPASIRP